MLKKYREEYFWDEYFKLVDNNEDKAAKLFYFKYSIVTVTKYLLFMYIPFVVINWVIIDKLCQIFF